MGYYTNASGEVKQIDADTYAAWQAANNPKADAYTAIPDPATPYDRWDGTQWVSPPPYVPQIVSRFQAKAALLSAGLLDQVEAMMADPATPAVTKLAWAEAVEFNRQSPTVLAMASALSLTDQQLDDLFTAAAAISA
jgi:hypothetical protein